MADTIHQHRSPYRCPPSDTTRKPSCTLLSDTPMAETAPTRRSSRTAATPVQATAEERAATRAEARRRAGGHAGTTSSVVWGAPAVEPAPKISISDSMTDASTPVSSSSSRRAARASRSAVQPPAAVQAPAEPFELLASVADSSDTLASEQPVADVEAGAEIPTADEKVWAEASDADLFEAAARLFAFTGETPVQNDTTDNTPDEIDVDLDDASDDAEVRTPAPRGSGFKRLTAASFSVGVMGLVGLLAVGMTTPAEAVAAVRGADYPVSVATPKPEESKIDPDEIQAYVAPAGTENAVVARTENYSMTSMSELAYASGISNISNTFVNDPNAAIQWPFTVGVPISYGFGMRSGRMHQGVDFTPGAGSPIQSIADGVVRVASNSGGAYGVHVIIDHEIDGQLISSHYAHMQYGTIQVQVGQQVTVGTILGRTGNTGRSFGAHTHFELLVGGTTAIDPLVWLRAHTGG